MSLCAAHIAIDRLTTMTEKSDPVTNQNLKGTILGPIRLNLKILI
jgi:hypothetical protein